jgi:hypothetical protein
METLFDTFKINIYKRKKNFIVVEAGNKIRVLFFVSLEANFLKQTKVHGLEANGWMNIFILFPTSLEFVSFK